jgi:hypothetical protein
MIPKPFQMIRVPLGKHGFAPLPRLKIGDYYTPAASVMLVQVRPSPFFFCMSRICQYCLVELKTYSFGIFPKGRQDVRTPNIVRWKFTWASSLYLLFIVH